ncbi:MAG: CRTAC1 family protein [Balneolaceae bacterium]|nr:CRTAC1 family protein [Balneolaceae bacterium]MBO6547835.1 CRTAC1 family protein [Balneolaceae bacterium]MBO6648346.1 CRTAC1 family protein [Balneolaceae bacterium]
MKYLKKTQSTIYLITISILSCTSISERDVREKIIFTHTTSDFTNGRASTGGISLIDIDGDSDLDVYVSNGYDVSSTSPKPQKNRLYINDGLGGLHLDELSLLSNDSMFSSGSTWGDFNNDGFIDVFITNQRAQNNALFKGEGPGIFTKMESIVSGDRGHSYSANWVDVDADGDLDLYVANGGLSHREEDFLYRNEGRDSFVKVTSTGITKDTLSTIGGLWRDFNHDGLPDLYVSHRLSLDRVYFNQGNWEFEMVELEAPVIERYAFPKSAGTASDIDNDGDIDIYQTSLMGGANFLFINDGNGVFKFKESGALTSLGGHTYGATFADFNNDGVQEAVVANWGSSAQFFSQKQEGYEWVHTEVLGDQILFASTISSGDLNGDGKQDLLIPQWPNSKGEFEENHIYLNESRNVGNWLSIKLEGIKSNRSAIGARIKIECINGGKRLLVYDEVSSQQTWRSQSGLTKQLGVGHCKIIDTLRIEWPSSKVTELQNVAVNQLLKIKEPNTD